jgi:hypothetical protein
MRSRSVFCFHEEEPIILKPAVNTHIRFLSAILSTPKRKRKEKIQSLAYRLIKYLSSRICVLFAEFSGFEKITDRFFFSSLQIPQINHFKGIHRAE